MFPLPKDHTEMGTFVVKTSIDEFYEIFLSNRAKFTLEEFYQQRGDKNVKVLQNWSPPKDPQY